MFTSRSAIEAYQDCPRYRYNQYYLNGTGVVSKAKSVPLVTGSAVHKGVEHMLNRLRIGLEVDVELAVKSAVEQYINDVGEAGFSGKGLESDVQQWFTFNEQKALTEGLVRAWYYKELPNIIQRYKVVAVERDIEPLSLTSDILFQAKVDAELQEISSGDYHNYSLKTMKRWDEKSENSYKSDLQGLTEIWAVEEDSKRFCDRWEKLVESSIELVDSPQYPVKQMIQIWDYLVKKRPEAKRVMGVRFCFLIKGTRMIPPSLKNDPNALYITYSPLIRGYKNIGIAGISYAHSWNYPNPENKSGNSILGKGWEPFNVWESPISIAEWVEKLATNQIQAECGDVVKAQVITPGEYFRGEGDIEEAITEIRWQENHINHAIELLDSAKQDDSDVSDIMADYFKHHRKHCNFHFGGLCEYKPLCWQPEVKDNVEELYHIRTPHHEAERNQ